MLMRTYSGVRFNPLEPYAVSPMDVAWGISQIRRYGGNSPHPYDVAHHSVRVMERLWDGFLSAGRRALGNLTICQLKLLLQGLCHGGGGAYIGDMIFPAKMGMPGFVAIEEECQKCVLAGLGVAWPLEPLVHEADKLEGRVERSALWLSDTADINSRGSFRTWLDYYYKITDLIERKEAECLKA